MEGHSVTVMAQYEGNEDDPNLGVYWCVYKTLHDYYCYNTTEEDDNYIVKTDGCPTHNKTCCYFTVLLTIQSVTRDLTLQTIIVWLQNPGIFIPGNSSLGMGLIILGCFKLLLIVYYSCQCVPCP